MPKNPMTSNDLASCPLDVHSYELSNSQLTLRDDLKLSIRTESGEPYCVLEDPVQNRFFRLGYAEYTLVSLLNGEKTIAALVESTSHVLGRDALNLQQASQVAEWLVQNGLAFTAATSTPDRVMQSQHAHRKRQRKAFRNPLLLQVPIGNPDRFLKWLTPKFAWCFHWSFVALAMVVCFYAGWSLLLSERSLSISMQRVLTSQQWISFALVGIGLKLIHELAHGVTCRYFGGTVPEFGIFWFLFIPIPYIDVTSSWRFERRSQRILVATAGILIELFVVAIATLIWCQTELGWLNQIAAQTILLGSVVTILFNANPLMRFDGYYVLSDVMKIPNLAPKGRSWVKDTAARLFFGTRSTKPVSRWVKVYGAAAFLWQILVVVSILIATANLFEGVGLVMAGMGVVIWFGIPLFQLVRFLLDRQKVSRWGAIRFIVVSAFLLLAGWIFFFQLPAPRTISVPVVVGYDDEVDVRCATAGFVKEILVGHGQVVEQGDPLFVLKNDEIEIEWKRLQIELAAIEFGLREAHAIRDVAAKKMLSDNRRFVVEKMSDLEIRKSQLIVRAERSGLVLTDAPLAEWSGRYAVSGTRLCSVGNPHEKKLSGLVDEDDSPFLRSEIPRTARLFVWGEQNYWVPIDGVTLSPNSVRQSPHFGLTSVAGGPYTVVESEIDERSNSQSNWMLVRSAFELNCPLQGPVGSSLQAGQLGELQIRVRTESLGRYLVRRSYRWLANRLSLSHGI